MDDMNIIIDDDRICTLLDVVESYVYCELTGRITAMWLPMMADWRHAYSEGTVRLRSLLLRASEYCVGYEWVKRWRCETKMSCEV